MFVFPYITWFELSWIHGKTKVSQELVECVPFLNYWYLVKVLEVECSYVGLFLFLAKDLKTLVSMSVACHYSLLAQTNFSLRLNPLIPDIHIQILATDLHTFP